MHRTIFLLVCLSLSTLLSAQGAPLLLRNINVVNVENGKVKKSTILIKDGTIQAISKKDIKIAAAKVIDGEGKYLIPGLFDTHIHLFQSGSVYTRPDAIDLREYRNYDNEVEWVLGEAGDLLKRYLRCGITTVYDVGGPMSNYTIRDEYSDNSQYPNIYLTGPLLSPYQPEALIVEDPPILLIQTEEEARQEVQRQLEYKPDFIKLWYIAGQGLPADSSYAMISAAIDESHKNGLKVAVHATELKTAKLAIKAGADFLVHSIDDEFVDKEFIDLLLKNDISYIPTLNVHPNYINTFLKNQLFTPQDFKIANPYALGSYFDLTVISNNLLDTIQLSDQIRSFFESRLNQHDSIVSFNLALLNKKGVNICTGTDAGNIGTHHGSSFYDEISSMSSFGMSNLDILQASTLNASKILGKENILGSIEVGKMADLVILSGNPMEDINALKEVETVIKNGHVHYIDSIIELTPEDLVQQQVNGYNAGDIEAFMAPYSDSLEIYNFPNTLQQKGKKNIAEGYKKMFANVPNLHCEILNRTVHGNTVIDKERITGLPDGKIMEALAIYEIEYGKIQRVYFGDAIMVESNKK